MQTSTIGNEVRERTARVDFHRDLRPGVGLHWRLFTDGDGHWCRAENHMSRYTSKQAAIIAGAVWIKYGTQPCEQTDEQRAEVVALHEAAKSRAADLEASVYLEAAE